MDDPLSVRDGQAPRDLNRVLDRLRDRQRAVPERRLAAHAPAREERRLEEPVEHRTRRRAAGLPRVSDLPEDLVRDLVMMKLEAVGLRYEDITADGLVIRQTKFRSPRLEPLHQTARAGLKRYLERRRPYAPFDDHVFISLQRKPLNVWDVDRAFRAAVTKVSLPHGRGRPQPTPHSLRHFFAVRALETCPDGRDRIAQHMVALSTVLGHRFVESTYWYLEATAELMTDIAERSESFFKAGQS